MRDWRDFINVDLPKVGEITQKMIDRNVKYSSCCGGSSTRMAMGRVWTNATYKARRRRVLETPLP